MLKYYWYMNVDTDVMTGYNIEPYVKRSISPPSGKPYIVETINGYKHSIKRSDGTPIAEINDMGNVSEIKSISSLIIQSLARLVELENKKKQAESNERNISDMMSSDRYSQLYIPGDELSMMSTYRRKRRIKSRVNRPPIKKKVLKKRK